MGMLVVSASYNTFQNNAVSNKLTNFSGRGEVWALGYNKFDFFEKTNFLGCYAFKVCKKCQYVLNNIFAGKNKKVLKSPEYHADFKSEEKFFKNATQKVLSKTTLTNMIKSEKSAYSITFLFISLFIWNLFPFFQQSQIQHTILHFLISTLNASNTYVLCFATLMANAHKKIKKNQRNIF